MPYCNIMRTIRLQGIIPYADKNDILHDTLGGIKTEGKPYYFAQLNDHVIINGYQVPINKWDAWVNGGVVVIIAEEENAMNNLPAIQQECAVVPISPQEQIAQASDMARLLKDVVNKAGLARKLGGKKEHLEFEAWQTIARWHHCTPSTEWTRPIKDGEKIIGWEARVNVLDADGKVIGSSEGMCMADEHNWNGKPSYALRSMAQTRTAGKALRSLFAHVAVLAGYSPTPAEEMDGVETRPEPPPPSRQQAPPPPPPTPEPKPQVKDDIPASLEGFDIPPGDSVVFVPDKVTRKTGNRNGKDWVRYGVLSGDVWYNTFSTDFGDIAESACDYKIPVRIVFKETKFGRDIEFIEQYQREPGEEG